MIEVNLRYDSNLKLNKLLKGVLSYISSNDYLIKKQKVRVIEAESEVAYLKDLINKLSTSNKLIYNLTSLIDRKIELENFIKTNEIVEVISVNSPSIYDSQIGFKGKILRVVLLSVLGLSFGFFFLYIKNFRSAYLLRN
jgi:spore germination protein GerM